MPGVDLNAGKTRILRKRRSSCIYAGQLTNIFKRHFRAPKPLDIQGGRPPRLADRQIGQRAGMAELRPYMGRRLQTRAAPAPAWPANCNPAQERGSRVFPDNEDLPASRQSTTALHRLRPTVHKALSGLSVGFPAPSPSESDIADFIRPVLQNRAARQFQRLAQHGLRPLSGSRHPASPSRSSRPLRELEAPLSQEHDPFDLKRNRLQSLNRRPGPRSGVSMQRLPGLSSPRIGVRGDESGFGPKCGFYWNGSCSSGCLHGSHRRTSPSACRQSGRVAPTGIG